MNEDETGSPNGNRKDIRPHPHCIRTAPSVNQALEVRWFLSSGQNVYNMSFIKAEVCKIKIDNI